MTEPRFRGYFGIGVEGVSKSANVGALLRTAHAFGAAFCFTIATGWDARAARCADTSDSPSHVPLWRFPDIASLAVTQRCVLVGDEPMENAIELPSFRHPLNAAYVPGPERSALSPELLARCQHVVRIPTRFALNLSLCGALVVYDRLLQHGRFAERAVGSKAAASWERGTPARRAAVSAQHSGLDGVIPAAHDNCICQRSICRASSVSFPGDFDTANRERPRKTDRGTCEADLGT